MLRGRDEWIAVGAALSLLAGCGDEGRALIVDLPERIGLVGALFESTDGAQVSSSGLVERDPSGAFRVFADPEASEATRVVVVGYERAQLLSYALPGEDALTRSPLLRAAPEDRHLPSPTLTACGAFEDAETTMNPCALSGSLTTTWLEACPDACDMNPLSTLTGVPLPGEHAGLWLGLPFDETRRAALMVGASGRFYRVTATVAVELTELSTNTGIVDGFMRDDGEIWLLTSDARLLAGRPSTGFHTVASAPTFSHGVLTNLVGSTHGPPEAYASDNAGLFARWDGQSWSTLHRAIAPECCFSALEWLGPEQAVALFARASEVVFYRAGEIEVDRRIPDPRAATMIPDFGLVVGAAGDSATGTETTLHVWRDGEWIPLETRRIGTNDIPVGIWPLGHGFLFGGLRGLTSYYSLGLGDCGARPLVRHNVKAVVRVQDALLVAPQQATQGVLEVSSFALARTLPSPLGCGSL